MNNHIILLKYPYNIFVHMIYNMIHIFNDMLIHQISNQNILEKIHEIVYCFSN